MGHREQADDTDGPRQGTQQKGKTSEEPHQRRQQVTTTLKKIVFPYHRLSIDWDIERGGLRPDTPARGCRKNTGAVMISCPD
jgi:hypothetical protein